jgi:Protein of unknown function (DUF3800)
MIPADDRSPYSYLLGALLPRSGYVVNFATVYIDESCSHEASPILVMAGFLYEREHAELLELEWKAILERENMPFLHMKDFTKPGQKPYAHLSEDRKKELSVEFVDLIQKHRTLSFATVVNEAELNEVFAEFLIPVIFRADQRHHNTYAWTLLDCLKNVIFWIEKTGFDGDVAYIFEAGHRDQKTANAVMELVTANPDNKKRLHHRSHTFSTKTEDAPLQTADMYAWLSGNCAKRVMAGNNTGRKDWTALFENRVERHARTLRIWNKSKLIELAVEIAGKSGLLTESAITAFLSKWRFE